VIVKGEACFPPYSFATADDARMAAAVVAMHRFEPQRSLHRVLPHDFRQLWHALGERKEQREKQQVCASAVVVVVAAHAVVVGAGVVVGVVVVGAGVVVCHERMRGGGRCCHRLYWNVTLSLGGEL